MRRNSRCSLILVTSSLFLWMLSQAAWGKPPQISSAVAPPSATQLTLATASAPYLLTVYSQLRSLQGSNESAVTENVVWKRDAANFTFTSGQLTFAAPVAGRVLAAVFTGDATFELDPPTAIERRQIARFTHEPKLAEAFRHAVFFFTDNSWQQLQKLLVMHHRGDAQAATKALGARATRYQQDDNDWFENQRAGNFVMRNLAARMLADLTDPSSKGFFLADIEDGRYAGLLYQISWNRKSFLLPAVPNDEEVMLLHYKTGEYFEWWAGFHLSSEYQGNPHPSHDVLPAHCQREVIDATISKSNRLSATAQMNFQILRGTPRLLPLNLAGVLRISSVTGAGGRPLSFIQEDRNLDNDPWLILPAPARPGESYSVKIAYQEQSTRESRVIDQMGSGLFFVGERTSWYPNFGAGEDRTNFDLHFISPERYEFVATGQCVSSKKEKQGRVSEYVSQIPFSVVGFNYGDFVTKSYSNQNFTVAVYAGKQVPDQLADLANRLQMAQMAQGPMGGDVAARTGILVGGFNTAAGAKYAAAKSYEAFRLYQAAFGPLPFHIVSVTEQPVGFFGQSWPTLVFLPYLSLLDPTTLNSLHLQSNEEARIFFDVVAVHELSHQWWGHMVGWKTYHDQWLSEGFADFSAALFLQEFEPKKFKTFWDHDRFLLLSKDRAGHRPVDVAPLWLNFQGNAHLEPGESQLLIYRKGAYVLEMLRMIMKHPGTKDPDATFFAMLRDFVKTYAAKSASTADFERIAEKNFGRPLDWFFNEWVYGTETPTYDFRYQLSSAPQGKTLLRVALTQSDVPSSFLMMVPVYVYLKGAPRLIGFLRVEGPQTVNAAVTLPVQPEKVAIDVNHTLLAVEKQ